LVSGKGVYKPIIYIEEKQSQDGFENKKSVKTMRSRITQRGTRQIDNSDGCRKEDHKSGGGVHISILAITLPNFQLLEKLPNWHMVVELN